MGDEYARMLAGCVTQCDHQAELETLRGIAKRNADGWSPNRLHRRWEKGGIVVEREEPMTDAEIQAIYGSPEEEENG